MNDEEIRNIIKNQLKHLGKEQLIDALTDICMANPAFRMAGLMYPSPFLVKNTQRYLLTRNELYIK